jgi:peptide/nickel transport system ATP-binding protein
VSRNERAAITAPLLVVDGLSIGYPAAGGVAHVLSAISFSLGRGESLGIVGESGCGKSSLALALLGFLRPGAQHLGGEVRLDGRDLLALPPAELQTMRGRRVALVPQSAAQSLTPSTRVGDQIVEVLAQHRGLTGAAALTAAVDLLDQVRLPESAAIARRYPHQLSGGQQQRVAIAMALAGGPELLVLDEPTTGLDVTTQAQILDLLDAIRSTTGAALIYVSHDLGVIARVSEGLAVMYAGEVVEHGPVEELFLRPRHPYTRGLLASAPRLDRAGLPMGMSGAPPAPGARPHGCAFAPRCAFAGDECRTEAPRLERATPAATHLVRCVHQARVAVAPPEVRPAAPALAASSGEPLVEVVGLEVRYGARGLAAIWGRATRAPQPAPAVRDLDLAIMRGETLALVGESGSGKSSLARAIAGLQSVTAGHLRLGAHDLGRLSQRRSRELRRAVQLIFQNPDASLNPRQTVGRILERPLELFFAMPQPQRRRRVVELLEQMRLGAHYAGRLPGQLSGGEKQRVAIARAFAAEPELILCDEVVSALDVSVQAAVLELLARLKAERGVTYLFISHDLAVVRAIADRVAVLFGGQLCEIGPVERVYAPPFHPYTEALLAAVPEPRPVSPRIHRAVEAPAAGSGSRGCPFAGRCPRQLGPICADTPPPWREAPAGHLIRCHIALEELAAGQSPAAPIVMPEPALPA